MVRTELIFFICVGAAVALPSATSDDYLKRAFRSARGKRWGYGANDGPNTWSTESATCLEGWEQSPIDIDTRTAVYNPQLAFSRLNVYFLFEYNMKIENNGHTLMATAEPLLSDIDGGPLKDLYFLEQFHLHWGSKDTQGSEHTVDGQQYAAELHFVTWNSKYSTVTDASTKPDGLAVISVLIEVGNEHTELKKITDAIPWIRTDGSSTIIPGVFDPYALLPQDTNSYWTYYGSLTTPPCSESVTWLVYEAPISMSAAQLEALRTMTDHDGGSIEDNFRPTRPLNGRTVEKSFY